MSWAEELQDYIERIHAKACALTYADGEAARDELFGHISRLLEAS